MEYRKLGSTGLDVSVLALGAGPISSLMTGEDHERQAAVVQRAVDAGINWIDTAATYGDGKSETNVGRALTELDLRNRVHVATKVRLFPDDLSDIRGKVFRSAEASLDRLRLPRVTLLQLHNSVTRSREDEPASITPEDILGTGGVLSAFQDVRDQGLADYLGITGLGEPDSLKTVITKGEFATMQVPYNLLNPSAGRSVQHGFAEANYGNVIAVCREKNMGVFAIRVFAGGALIGAPPSDHTYRTRFFPLDLYHRDQQRATRMAIKLGAEISPAEAAVRFVISGDIITSAIVGFGDVTHVDDAVHSAGKGPISSEQIEELLNAAPSA